MTVFTLHATRLDRLDLHRLIVVLFNIIINEVSNESFSLSYAPLQPYTLQLGPA